MSENITIRGQVFEICECGICGVFVTSTANQADIRFARTAINGDGPRKCRKTRESVASAIC